ncbi:MAG: hypothetical protein DWQ04_26770 [Chloroflexi bacterium]|nr:MAG: hypothetical protein DWQ04_26770 [Chloroflexota bacterium]
MNSEHKIFGVEIKVLLSTLWIFVLLNMIFRDIHEMPYYIEEWMTQAANGAEISELLMLVGGIMVEIPILMVLLSRVLPYRINRWANIIAGVFFITSIFGFPPGDLDDFFFVAIEIASSSFIIWQAWTWPKPSPQANIRQLSSELN